MTGPLAILGPGTLGLGLARWAAERGLAVTLAGRQPGLAERALDRGAASWLRDGARRGLSPAQVEAARQRIRAVDTWAAAAEGAAAVLEALPEDLARKAQAWSLLDVALDPATLRLTGSSSLALAAIRREAAMGGPLLGFHCFLPLPRMAMVELVTEADAPPEAVTRALALADSLGLRVAQVRDQAGYAASRMALAQGLEAMRLLASGCAAAADLDALMVHGYGHPCGPLELSDRIGLDLRLTIAQNLYQATGDPRFEPPAILVDKVARGETGRKAGAGFYPWAPIEERQ